MRQAGIDDQRVGAALGLREWRLIAADLARNRGVHQQHWPPDRAQRPDQPLDETVMRFMRRLAGLVLQHADAIDHDVGAALRDQFLQARLVEARDRRLQRAWFRTDRRCAAEKRRAAAVTRHSRAASGRLRRTARSGRRRRGRAACASAAFSQVKFRCRRYVAIAGVQGLPQHLPGTKRAGFNPSRKRTFESEASLRIGSKPWLTIPTRVAAYAATFERYEQAFPTLTPQEIERLRRFGEARRFADGELLFETGKPRGMHVILSGHVTASQRDGLGHVTLDPGFRTRPVSCRGRLAVGPASLVDGHAEGEVEALVIPPEDLRRLLIAEAELGERIMRALILRRVSLIDSGVGGVVLIGSPNCRAMWRGSRISSPATPFRIICSIPRPTAKRRKLIARYAPQPARPAAGGGAERHRAAQSGRARDSRMRSACSCRREPTSSTTSPWSAAAPAGLSTAVYAGSEGLSVIVLDQRALRRPGRRERADRELFRLPDRHFGHGARQPRVRAGAEIRQRDHDPGRRSSRSIARARTAPSCSNTDEGDAHPRALRGDRERRALSPACGRQLSAIRRPRRLVLGLADRGAAVRQRGRHPRRRRQFGRPGGGVPLRARLQGAHHGARRRTCRHHVALSDRPHRGSARISRCMPHTEVVALAGDGRPRASALAQPQDRRGSARPRSATCSCSSAPIPRPAG